MKREKKWNIVNKNVWINDEFRSKIVQNITKSLNTDDQIFENMITSNNLLNSKIRNIYAKIKFSTRRSNRLIEIENLLNNVERRTNTTAFATINKISIEKKWNAMKIENLDVYTNDCNFKKFLTISLIFRNRVFTIRIFSKQSTLSMNMKKKYNDVVTTIENTNFNTSAVALYLSIL